MRGVSGQPGTPLLHLRLATEHLFEVDLPPRSMLLSVHSIFWVAFSFLVGLGGGILCGWRLCRGLAEAQPVTLEGGEDALRVTLDPGLHPWSGAQVCFIDPETSECLRT